MAQLKLNNIRKSFGNVEVIKGIDLTIDKGEFVVFVGPSGCGKSTMLRMIAGLEDVSDGTIEIGGRDMTQVPPSKRDLAMVFQSYALFPHMTVAQNIGFGLNLAKVPKPEIAERVRKVAGTLQLETLLDRTPRQLSGGQRQRVAIGRSIIRDPKVFLFDEPLSNLDAALRVQMRLEIARLHANLSDATMIYVTHDQTEAMTLADRIVVFNEGRVEQVGTPMELYDSPANIFVAGFIGAPSMNFIDGVTTDGNLVEIGNDRLPLPAHTHLRGAVTLGIRPEHMEIVATGPADFTARAEIVEKLGAETLVHLATALSSSPITLRLDSSQDIRSGETVGVQIDHAKTHVFARA